MRQVLHRRGDVVHGVTLEHAQPELVEKEKLHGVLPLVKVRVRARLYNGRLDSGDRIGNHAAT